MAQDRATAPAPAPAIFLGALASEVNEPDELAPAFAGVARAVERIVAAIRAGTVSSEEGAQHLAQLRVTDGSGAVWTVGATSMRWYRKLPGRSWKLAPPPATADEQAVASSAAALDLIPAQYARDPEPGRALDGYGVDTTDLRPARGPAPWEFEPGEDRYVSRSGGQV